VLFDNLGRQSRTPLLVRRMSTAGRAQLSAGQGKMGRDRSRTHKHPAEGRFAPSVLRTRRHGNVTPPFASYSLKEHHRARNGSFGILRHLGKLHIHIGELRHAG